MFTSLSFEILGNRYPSAAERTILLDAIQRDEKRLEAIQVEISTNEEQWKAAHAAFEDTMLPLEDAKLRLRVISSLLEATRVASEAMENISLEEEDETRLDTAPATGKSHLTITSRLLKQHEKPKTFLRENLVNLEVAEKNAQKALASEEEAYNVAQIRLVSLDEDLKICKGQASVFEASIQAKNRHFSSARQLTAETWLCIFQFVTSSPLLLNELSLSKLPVLNPALSLSRVCQKWGEITYSNPSLWGFFYIRSLALDKASLRFLEFCLAQTGSKICHLYIQTQVGMVSQARILVDILRDFKVHELSIDATVESIEAANHLIQSLPPPKCLVMECHRWDKQLGFPIFVGDANPKDMQSVTLINYLFHPAPQPSSSHLISMLTVHFDHPLHITHYIADHFSNITSIRLQGSHHAPPSGGPFTFANLTDMTGPLVVLLTVFSTRCFLPALNKIGTWLTGDDPGHRCLNTWKDFLKQNKLVSQIKCVKVFDMEPKYAMSMITFILEIPLLQRLDLVGRNVDVFLKNMVSTNPEHQQARRILALHSLSMENYAGNCSLLANFLSVHIKHWEGVASAQKASSTPHRIKEVTWVNCDNVTLQTRKEVGKLLHT